MDFYIALSYFIKIGIQTLQKGREKFGTVGAFYNAPYKDLLPILGEKMCREFLAFRESFNKGKKVEELKRQHIQVISFEDTRMPVQLKHIPDPPLCLFVKGNIDSLSADRIIGIVGTRKVSSYGRQVTSLFGSRLAENGVTIVSGMALGVDTLAHTSCIDGGGHTIAVLGCGVDIIYPAVNRLLYQRILQTGGAIISELPPSTMPKRYTFVLRNRLISGLSRGVLVVEGALSSGSMITAKYAVEQGKDVFAVPMPLLSSGSAGPNSLLKQGAKLVLDPGDILAEYGFDSDHSLRQTLSLSEEEDRIYRCLKEEPMSVQELIQQTQFSVSVLLPLLSVLEIKRLILKNREGKYEVIFTQLHQSVLVGAGTSLHGG